MKEHFLNKFRDLYNDFKNSLNHSDASVLTLLPDFIEVFQKAAISMRRVMHNCESKIRVSAWCNKDCSKAKYLKNNVLRHFRQTNSQHSLNSYLDRKKHYTYFCKVKK